MLERRTLTLLVAVGTLVLTGVLFVVVPKGFFPVQDTGEIQAVTESTQSVSFTKMARQQQQVAAEILKNPAVDSLSSFIGVDGTNTTLNSGRIQINLKPLSQRKSASDVIRELQASVRNVEGVGLVHAAGAGHLGGRHREPNRIPVQHAGPERRRIGDVRKEFHRTGLRQLPELEDVASDQQNDGRRAALEFDRATASRLGLTTQNLDDTLYDAFGQRADFHAVHAVESVSCDSGGRPVVSGQSG